MATTRHTLSLPAGFLAGALVFSSSAFAGPGPGAPGGFMAGGPGSPGACPLAGQEKAGSMRAFFEDLDLTPAQRQSLQAIGERYRTRGWDLMQRGQGVREQLMSVAPDDPNYAAATRAAGEAAGAIAADAVVMLSEMRAEMSAVLTPEQRALVQARLNRDRDRWKDWRQRHQAPQQP